jgi:hypothetical protein
MFLQSFWVGGVDVRVLVVDEPVAAVLHDRVDVPIAVVVDGRIPTTSTPAAW